MRNVGVWLRNVGRQGLGGWAVHRVLAGRGEGTGQGAEPSHGENKARIENARERKGVRAEGTGGLNGSLVCGPALLTHQNAGEGKHARDEEGACVLWLPL